MNGRSRMGLREFERQLWRDQFGATYVSSGSLAARHLSPLKVS